MDAQRDREFPVIRLDAPPTDIARMSGFAAAESLALRRRRLPVPDALARIDR